MKKILFILSFVLYGFTHAQTHEWAKSLLYNGAGISTNGIDIDSNNNSYIIGSFAGGEFTIDNDTIKSKSNSPSGNSFIAKFDDSGKLVWIRTPYIYRISSSGTVNLLPHDIKLISDNKILIVGRFNVSHNVSAVLRISPTDSIISVYNGQLGFYVIYDSLGNVSKFGKLFEGENVNFLTNTNQVLAIDSKKNIYYTCGARSTNYFYSDKRIDTLNYETTSGSMIPLVAKVSPEFDSILWIKEVATEVPSNSNSFRVTSINVGIDNNLYISTLFSKVGTGTIIIDSFDFGQSLPNNHTKGALIVLTSSGEFVHKGFINNDLTQQDNIVSVFAIDTSRIYITGLLQDSLLYGNQWFASHGSPSVYSGYAYVARISLTKAAWVNITQNNIGLSAPYFPAPTTSTGGRQVLGDNKGDVYARFFFSDSAFSMGGLTNTPSIAIGLNHAHFAKFDSLGNALWLRSGVNTSDMQVGLNSDLVYCGNYNDSLLLIPFTLPFSQGSSGFIAKITDYSITRGDVSSGPYCAGDTFYVPYTKMGEYDTANFFIAELSDENGNFEGGERELGRIKATEDSTIIGQLPMFQVASSPNYRIRVRSTHPPVQSFYRLDSLRLLIYSRDKANPGPPETVCFGDSFRLNTFGGTAWEWSPNYRMNNPNARSPLIYPDRDTLFRIVISDSSGCGEPDTAFKQIFIRPKAQIQTQNVVNACWGLPVNLTANFTQGDSSQYRWTWFNADSSLWAPLQSDSFRTKDTFTFNYPQSNVNRRFALVLEDDCQTLKDTALITVRLSPHRISSILSTQDSVICYQSQQNLIADISGGDSATYQWQWFEVDAMGEFNFLKEDSIRFSDTLQVQLRPENKEFQRYALVSNDNCIPFFDTAYLNVNINPHQPQVGILPSDTAICPSTEVELVGQVNIGSALGYAFIWLDEANNIQQTDTGFAPALFVPSPDFSGGLMQRVYRLVAQDLCSPNADTAEVRITPRDPLQAIPNTFDTTVCSGTELSLSASGLGGVGSNYQYQWILNDNIISSDSDIGFIPPIDPSPSTIQLVLTDNCMPQNDTAKVIIRVKPALQSVILREPHHDHVVQDTTVCSGSELRFVAKALGGDSTNYSYEWLLNDSLIGTDSDVMVRLSNHHPSPSTLHLISKDGCTVPNDTTSVSINILPPLSVTLRHSKGDTLCAGEESVFFAQATGWIDSNYTYQWLLNGAFVSDLDSFFLTGIHPSPSTLQLILSDGCSSPNDTFVHEIYIRPSLTLDLSASTLCANPTTTLTANPTGGNADNYTIQWFDEAENMIGTGSSIKVTPTRLTTYKAILTDDCSQTQAEAQIQIDLIPSILELTASPTEGCEPLEIEFEIHTNYRDSFSGVLYISDTDSLIIENLYGRIAIRTQAINPLGSGIYTPSFQFISKLGCTGISQNAPTITVHPKPTASFRFEPDSPRLDNPEVRFQNLSTGATSYQWELPPLGTFTDFEPTIRYSDTGRFSVMHIAISDQDCRDTAMGEVWIQDVIRFFMPTAFSPNGDGINDVLSPSVLGLEVIEFNIFNRWGERIFSSKGQAWDGTYRGQPVQDGVYTYTLVLKEQNGKQKVFSGTIVLIR